MNDNNIINKRMNNLLCILDYVKDLPWWGNLLIGVVATIIALFVTYAFLHPRIRIYPIANIDKYGHVGFMIRNMGLFPIYDVSFKLVSLERTESCELSEDYIKLCGAERPVLYGLLKPIEESTIQVSTHKPMGGESYDNFWANSWIQLQVSARHRISGVSIVETCDFKREDLYHGIFLKGELYNLQNREIIAIPVIMKKMKFFFKWFEFGLTLLIVGVVAGIYAFSEDCFALILGTLIGYLLIQLFVLLGLIVYLQVCNMRMKHDSRFRRGSIINVGLNKIFAAISLNKDGTLSMKNPKSPAVLFLVVRGAIIEFIKKKNNVIINGQTLIVDIESEIKIDAVNVGGEGNAYEKLRNSHGQNLPPIDGDIRVWVEMGNEKQEICTHFWINTGQYIFSESAEGYEMIINEMIFRDSAPQYTITTVSNT